MIHPSFALCIILCIFYWAYVSFCVFSTGFMYHFVFSTGFVSFCGLSTGFMYHFVGFPQSLCIISSVFHCVYVSLSVFTVFMHHCVCFPLCLCIILCGFHWLHVSLCLFYSGFMCNCACFSNTRSCNILIKHTVVSLSMHTDIFTSAQSPSTDWQGISAHCTNFVLKTKTNRLLHRTLSWCCMAGLCWLAVLIPLYRSSRHSLAMICNLIYDK